MYGCESWTTLTNKAEHEELMLSNYSAGEDSWESLGQQGYQTRQSYRKSTLNIHWKDWCWSWISNILATWCKELALWKRPWRWERVRARGEGGNRKWDGWMVSLTQWTWVWVNSGRQWRTGKHSVLQSTGVIKGWTQLSNWTAAAKIHVLNSNEKNLRMWPYWEIRPLRI